MISKRYDPVEQWTNSQNLNDWSDKFVASLGQLGLISDSHINFQESGNMIENRKRLYLAVVYDYIQRDLSLVYLCRNGRKRSVHHENMPI